MYVTRLEQMNPGSPSFNEKYAFDDRTVFDKCNEALEDHARSYELKKQLNAADAPLPSEHTLDAMDRLFDATQSSLFALIEVLTGCDPKRLGEALIW